MIGPLDVRKFTEIDRLATERANKRGHRIAQNPWLVAFLMAVGTYLALTIFAALAGVDREGAFLPMLVVMGAVAGIAFWTVSSQQKAWFVRYHEAFHQLRAERGLH